MKQTSQPPVLAISPRTRSTPFTRRVEEEGVKAYSVYNHMLLPACFESVEADCAHLKTHVQVWDVSCERQVELKGPDSAKLMQLMTPRNLKKMKDDQCYYVPLTDETGGMLNDPVALKLDTDRWWVSLADSDVLYWAKGLAYGMRLDVDIYEPDVSPLGVQGPKADQLMERLFGEEVHKISFFRHTLLEFNRTKHVVARSGWSKQGGFEIYVEGAEHGEALWDALFETGRDLNLRAGCPNLIERIESGLLSYGNDMTREHNPYEAGLEKYCSLEAMETCIGGHELKKVAAEGPQRQLRGLVIPGANIPALTDFWSTTDRQGNRVGQVSSACWSPDMQTGIAIAMIDKSHWETGSQIVVETPEGARRAEVRPLPFI